MVTDHVVEDGVGENVGLEDDRTISGGEVASILLYAGETVVKSNGRVYGKRYKCSCEASNSTECVNGREASWQWGARCLLQSKCPVA